ncbi:3-deoxy-D-manno-octulosonic acid kinase [Aquimonas voraii]|uniref:3-deoxy-D-manno-octulosonic acid kinase n=1 Tax=Aquimonas voraii TaxID=265719 RepID=A0A1G6S6G0_9GAMM|nr:3-deoxy-D-manno-octulosonic acid kinase [Aquimonas voraii]SDD12490.1 3-deoxy-D-manno-octulosonic acid kinase [Aquimonas voraii]
MNRSEIPSQASETVQESRVTDARGALLFDRRRIAQADRLLLEPQHWAGRGRMEVARGGRGAVCFVRGEFGEAVIRHYRRGGLVGRVIRDLYLWTGEDGNRAFREFRLLAKLRDLGLPVPAPLAAGYARAGLFYRADLMTLAIPESRTLAQWLADGEAASFDWSGLGRLLARFHAAGAFHADLNAHNVMRDGAGALWLIDFDRGDLRDPALGWQRANLQRLARSLRKLGLQGEALTPAWSALSMGYAEAGGSAAACELKPA